MKEMKLLGLLLLTACAIFSQAPGPPPPGGPGVFRREMLVPRNFGMGAPPWKVVTGAPYTADVSNSMLQTLADGNTIQRTMAGKVARDSQGRTYLQETINSGPLAQNGPTTLTFITDPLAGYSYELNANTKIATRRTFKAHEANAPRPPNPQHRLHRDNANVVTADLGSQNIGGVNAQGKSVTRTIPAGEIGNAQPIVSKSEIWYSPDLQVVVLSKRDDPRIGQSTYTVSNISRSAPDASLFRVPSDYTVREAFRPRLDRPGGGPPPPPEPGPQ